MRLVRDDPTEYEIEWRFCKPGAKLLGIPTVFDSRVWEPEQRTRSGFDNAGLGEVTEGRCPRKIVRGLTRGTPTGPSGTGPIHGDPSWWATGLPSRSLFSLERPTTLCGILPWMGKGVAIGPACDETVFASYSLLSGAGIKLGGEGVFVPAMTCCWPIHGMAKVKVGGQAVWGPVPMSEGGGVLLGGTGLFVFSDPTSFQGTGGIEVGGSGLFDDPSPGSGGVGMSGEGSFDYVGFSGIGGPEISGDGYSPGGGLIGDGGIMPRVSGIFGAPGLVGSAGPVLGGQGSFQSQPFHLEGQGGLELGGTAGAVGLEGEGGPQIGGTGSFLATDLVGAGAVEAGGEGDFLFEAP
jgi:hypothetical protein